MRFEVALFQSLKQQCAGWKRLTCLKQPYFAPLSHLTFNFDLRPFNEAMRRRMGSVSASARQMNERLMALDTLALPDTPVPGPRPGWAGPDMNRRSALDTVALPDTLVSGPKGAGLEMNQHFTALDSQALSDTPGPGGAGLWPGPGGAWGGGGGRGGDSPDVFAASSLGPGGVGPGELWEGG